MFLFLGIILILFTLLYLFSFPGLAKKTFYTLPTYSITLTWSLFCVFILGKILILLILLYLFSFFSLAKKTSYNLFNYYITLT
jgi:hypothetical protein